MKTVLLIGGIAGLATAMAGCQSPRAVLNATLVIKHAQIVDVATGRVQPDMTVVVDGDRIVAVGEDSATTIPSGAPAIDAAGRFLIPGLRDMHVHVFMGETADLGLEVTLPLLVANGVTGIRDMGSDLDSILQVREDIAAHRLTGPRMVVAGPMLDGPQTIYKGAIPIATADAGRRTVAMLKDRGVDFIKVQSKVPRDAYFAIADECKRLGLPLAGHVPDSIRAVEAVAAQQSSFEHLIGVFEGSSNAEEAVLSGPKGPGRFLSTYDERREQDLTGQISKRRVWQTPTLFWERGQWLVDTIDPTFDPDVVYAPVTWRKLWPDWTAFILKEWATDPVSIREAFVQHELQLVKRLRRAGVPFLAGTDAPTGVGLLPGFSLHHELARFVSGGFTPLEALQTATIGPAQFLGKERDLGTVATGKLADLLLLDADPTKDINNTRKIQAVVLAGRYLSRGDLDEILRKVKALTSP